jgi:hypothetical protein
MGGWCWIGLDDVFQIRKGTQLGSKNHIYFENQFFWEVQHNDIIYTYINGDVNKPSGHS